MKISFTEEQVNQDVYHGASIVAGTSVSDAVYVPKVWIVQLSYIVSIRMFQDGT